MVYGEGTPVQNKQNSQLQANCWTSAISSISIGVCEKWLGSSLDQQHEEGLYVKWSGFEKEPFFSVKALITQNDLKYFSPKSQCLLKKFTN